jgi:hypothetical protein
MRLGVVANLDWVNTAPPNPSTSGTTKYISHFMLPYTA